MPAAPGATEGGSPATGDLVAAIRHALELSDALGHDRIGIALAEALERARAIADTGARDGRPP